jgi:hypothetical protein
LLIQLYQFCRKTIEENQQIIPVREVLIPTDKFLVIFSESLRITLRLIQEIKEIKDIECDRNTTIFFPIIIDERLLNLPITSFALQDDFSDFSQWRDDEKYKKAFSKLVRDLTTTVSKESESDNNAQES